MERQLLIGVMVIFVTVVSLFGLLYAPAFLAPRSKVALNRVRRRFTGLRHADRSSRAAGSRGGDRLRAGDRLPSPADESRSRLHKKLLAEYLQMKNRIERDPSGDCAGRLADYSQRIMSILVKRYYY
jgi:hypothetical protein